MYLSNKATDMTLSWITQNNYQHKFKKAESIDDLKKLISEQLGKLNEKQKIGLRIVNWEAVFNVVKNILMLVIVFSFLVIPVNAVTIKQTYKVSSKYARPAVISPTLIAREGIRPPATKDPTMSQDTIGGSGRIVSIIKKYFGSEWKVAYAIFRAESGLRPNAKGYNCMYADSYGNEYSAGCRAGDSFRAWSVDCGIAQINFRGQECPKEALDPEWNIEKAYTWKYLPSGWSPWSVYQNGNYLAFLR